MSENPYAPPAAEVADVSDEASLERPQIVTIGIWLLWLKVFLAIPGWVAVVFSAPPNVPVAFQYARAVFGILVIGIMALLTYRAGQGRNWARIAHLILLVMRVGGLVFSYFVTRKMFPQLDLFSFDNPMQAALLLVNNLLAFAAVAMLFTPAANEWYRAMKVSR